MLAAGAAADRGDRLAVSCPLKRAGDWYAVGVRTAGDEVFVVTATGDTSLVATLSPQRRQLVARCRAARPRKLDVRGLAGPWPRRQTGTVATMQCSGPTFPATVTLDFGRIRSRAGRTLGDGLVVSSRGRPLVRVTATRAGGGVWYDVPSCIRMLAHP